MTNQKRAEKFIEFHGWNPNWGKEESVKRLVSKLDEAQREAYRNGYSACKATRGNTRYDQGFASAREKAAGLAEKIIQNDMGQAGSWKTIPDQIRKMEA